MISLCIKELIKRRAISFALRTVSHLESSLGMIKIRFGKGEAQNFIINYIAIISFKKRPEHRIIRSEYRPWMRKNLNDKLSCCLVGTLMSRSFAILHLPRSIYFALDCSSYSLIPF